MIEFIKPNFSRKYIYFKYLQKYVAFTIFEVYVISTKYTTYKFVLKMIHQDKKLNSFDYNKIEKYQFPQLLNIEILRKK